jgi:hypothetical protein
LQLAVVLPLLVAPSLVPAFAEEVTDRSKYIDRLQEKILKVYFPPRGPFNFAASAIKITVDLSGKANLTKIVQPPMVRGRRSLRAEGCLKSAVQNVNPLEKPPVDLKLPASFLVKFVPQAKGATVFRCVVQPL